MSAPLIIAGREFSSRLFLGTGKFPSNGSMRDALAASGTQIVTVALRRADLSGAKDPYANILEFIDGEKYLLLPNTSGAMNAAEAVRLARLAAAAGLPKWVKLEIHPDPRFLLPDPIETLKAAEILVKEGDEVQQGDVLMRMDARLSAADARALHNEMALKRLQGSASTFRTRYLLLGPTSLLSRVSPDADAPIPRIVRRTVAEPSGLALGARPLITQFSRSRNSSRSRCCFW